MPELAGLLRHIAPEGALAVAYSGGLDSRFLVHAAQRAGLAVRAVHAHGPHVPSRESEYALDWAGRNNVPVTLAPLNPLRVPALAGNPRDRCYHCKKAMFAALKKAAGALPLCDGTNASDTREYRPGLRALAELAIASPLAAAGYDKDAIRRAAAATGLENPNQAARPCLLTRFDYDTPISAAQLAAVDSAEQEIERVLAGYGYASMPFRIRYERPDFPALHLPATEIDSGVVTAVQKSLARLGLANIPVRRLEVMSGYFDQKVGRG